MTGPQRRRRHGFTRARLDELLDTEERLDQRLQALGEQLAAVGRGLENLTGRTRTAEARVRTLGQELAELRDRLSVSVHALATALDEEDEELPNLTIGDRPP